MKNKIIAGTFLAMLAVFVIVLSLPADIESIKAENREMSALPPFTQYTIFSGEFASGFERCVGDSVGYRSFFTELSKGIESTKGFSPETGRIIATDKDMGTKNTQKQTLLVSDNTIMEMFVNNPQQEKEYIDIVNKYAQKLPENIKMYSMIVPTQLSFKEPIYKNLQDDQEKVIADIYKNLDSRITTVDAYSELSQHTDEYIYFRTDHHWTQRGAYYGYRAFMNAEGGEAVNMDSYEENTIPNMLGGLYDKVNDPMLVSVPDSLKWFDINSDNHIKTAMYDFDEDGDRMDYNGVMYDRNKINYTFFFGCDHPVVEMTNKNKPDGKTLVVIKESYANALTPWLIESYRKVIMIDPRIYKADFSKIIDKYSPDEVLITNYIFSTNFKDYCELLSNMYK